LTATTPRIHAVVVHHRGQSQLSRCLESLLASREVDLHVALVANACEERLPRVAEAHPRVHVLASAAPLGFSAANNRGEGFLRERAGRPEHLYFVNNDTTSEPDALRRLVAHLDADPTCAVAGPRLMIEGPGDKVNSLGLRVTRTAEAWDDGIGRSLEECGPLPAAKRVLAATGSALLARREAYERIGGWSEIYHYYYEDIDLCLRARGAGHEVAVVPGAVVDHAVSATARRDSEFKLYHTFRNRLLLLVLHWPASLLARVAPRVVGSELWRLAVRAGRGPRPAARAQVLAWAGFLRRLPAALAMRPRETDRTWVTLLESPGAMPAIRLPAAPVGGGDPATRAGVAT
jgi:GT2 family glycosyltransferase